MLQWAGESRDRLAQLDVSEEALAGLRAPRRRAGGPIGRAPQANSARCGAKAAKRLAKEVTAELSGLAMADAEFTIEVADHAGRAPTIRAR